MTSNSERKRQQRQMLQSSTQSAHDKAQYERIVSAQRSAENRLFWLKCARWALGIAAMMGGCVAIKAHDDRVAAENDALAQAKYAKWVAYRDANCKTIEKVYGLSMTSGKFSSNDNTVVYDCNGVKYMMSARAEENIKQRQGNVEFIPNVP